MTSFGSKSGLPGMALAALATECYIATATRYAYAYVRVHVRETVFSPKLSHVRGRLVLVLRPYPNPNPYR